MTGPPLVGCVVWSLKLFSNNLMNVSIVFPMYTPFRSSRVEHIRELRWEFGSVLPADIKYNLAEQEVLLLVIIS